MAKDKNFMERAFDALVAGRERQARAYVDRFEREYASTRKLTKR